MVLSSIIKQLFYRFIILSEDRKLEKIANDKEKRSIPFKVGY